MKADDVLALLQEWTRTGATGAVEWRDDKRRRLLFFDSGQLVGLQSNLKSEGQSRVSERFPDLTGEDLRIRIAETRLGGLLTETSGELFTHPGAPPSAPEELDLGALVWANRAVLPRPGAEMNPGVGADRAGLLEHLPVAPEVRLYLSTLDGTRDLEEVLAFGPAAPEVLMDALAAAMALGAIDTNPGGVGTRVVGAGLPLAEAVTPGPRGSPTGETSLTDPSIRLGPVVSRVRAGANHFEVLGVPLSANAEAIRRAYRDLARDLHPDNWAAASPQQRAEVEHLFDRVRAAWEVLSVDQARADYLRYTIGGEKTEAEEATEQVRRILEAEAEFKRGVFELNHGRLLAAHELFTRAYATVPDDISMQAYQLYTSFRLAVGKEPRKAEAAMRELQALNDRRFNFDQGRVLLGWMYRALDDEERAFACFEEALTIRPTNVDATREIRRGPKAVGEEDEGIFMKLFGWMFKEEE